VLQDLDKGTEMLEVGGNRVFSALSVGAVGVARVIEGKVDIMLTLETIRDALDFLQNSNAITFVTLCLEILERSEFCFHCLAALAPNDRVSGFQITIEIVSGRTISKHLRFPDSDNKPVGSRNFEFRGLQNFGPDKVFCNGNHVAMLRGYLSFLAMYSWRASTEKCFLSSHSLKHWKTWPFISSVLPLKVEQTRGVVVARLP